MIEFQYFRIITINLLITIIFLLFQRDFVDKQTFIIACKVIQIKDVWSVIKGIPCFKMDFVILQYLPLKIAKKIANYLTSYVKNVSVICNLLKWEEYACSLMIVKLSLMHVQNARKLLILKDKFV